MDSMTGMWEGLHADVLNVIVRKLSYSDAIRFSAVCTSWLGAAKASRLFSQPLLLSYDALQPAVDQMYFQLHILSENKLGRDLSDIVVPLGEHCRCSLCFGTSKGMAVLMGPNVEDGMVFIFNFFTGDKFYFPPVGRLIFGITKKYRNPIPIQVAKVVILATSDKKIGDEANLVLVLACRSPDSCIVFYQAGSWAMLLRGYQDRDMIAHERRLFLLSPSGSVEVWDFSSDRPTKVISYAPSEALPSITVKPDAGCQISEVVYLVKSMGDFLLVRKRVLMPIWNDWRTRAVVFEVYKSCLGVGEKWEKVESLGNDRALFLGMNESVSVSSRDLPEGCKANTIYFTCDHRDSGTVIGHLMQDYNMEHKGVKILQPRFNDNDPLAVHVPFWLVKSA